MNKKFLDNVLYQILSETRIDMEWGQDYVPFHPFVLYTSFFQHHFHIFVVTSSFTIHCEEIYSLNYEEREYVWNEYKRIIKDKIENNGL